MAMMPPRGAKKNQRSPTVCPSENQMAALHAKQHDSAACICRSAVNWRVCARTAGCRNKSEKTYAYAKCSTGIAPVAISTFHVPITDIFFT